MLAGSPKYEAPPLAVIPPLSSFTTLAENTDRSVREVSGRFEWKNR